MNITRAVKILGGHNAAAGLLKAPVQIVANAASGKRTLAVDHQVALAQAAADVVVTTYRLKHTPFVRAWVAKLLLGDSRVTLPRGFARQRVTL